MAGRGERGGRGGGSGRERKEEKTRAGDSSVSKVLVTQASFVAQNLN